MQISRPDMVFIWQCHMGRCGGDGRRLQAHETVKLAVKKLVICCPTPAGCVLPSAAVLIEPRHLRQDQSRPGDLYAVGHGMHRKDSAMDIVVTSALQPSCLLPSTRSSDYVIKLVEDRKFRRDAASTGPIQNSATRRLIPLAMNHLGMRGGHFQAALKEFATSLVTKPAGCGLLQGPFAMSINGALRKILNTWGARLTWTAQRAHAAQIVGGMGSFLASAAFVSAYGPLGAAGGRWEQTWPD